MKNTWKKYAAVAMAGILSAGMLAGCGNKQEEAAFDGTKTVATINGEEIPMGLLSFVVRNEQAYMKAMYEAYGLGAYMSNLWDGKESEDAEMTYGEETRQNTLEQVELMYLLRAKAADYGVEVTAEEQEKIAEAAAAFMEANSEETIATLGVSEDIMKTYLELQTYFAKLHDPIAADADHEVADEQAQMSSFSYVHVTVEEEEAPVEEPEIDDTEDAEEDVEEDADAEESAEPTEAELKAKENAEAFYEALSADPEADMSELAKTIDDSLLAATGTFQTNLSEDWEDDTASYHNEDMIVALRELKEGEITAVIETEDDGYYVARLDKAFDEEATEKEREKIISSREESFYTETTEAWIAEADITVDEEVLNTLKVTDAMVFSTVSHTAENTDEVEAEDVDFDEAEEIEDESVEELTEEETPEDAEELPEEEEAEIEESEETK